MARASESITNIAAWATRWEASTPIAPIVVRGSGVASNETAATTDAAAATP